MTLVVPVHFNHTIVACEDQEAESAWFAELFGLPAPQRLGHFHAVALADQASIDFLTVDHDIAAQHYAFLVAESDFDAIYGRIVEREMQHWADPGAVHSGEINRHDGGRGVYFMSPSGHYLEIITRPYGGDAV